MSKVIHVPRRFVKDAWGGTETVVLETCKRLPTLGVTSSIYCPSALSEPGSDEIGGVPVRRFPYFYPYIGLRKEAAAALDRKGGNLFSFSLWHQLAREPALDLLHLHTAKRLGGIARTVARRRNIPYVISIHGGMIDVPAAEAATWTAPTAGTLEWGKALGMLVGSRRVLADADAIICVDCNEMEKMRTRYPGKRVEFVPNGVDPEPYKNGNGSRFREANGIPLGKKILLNVSRIDPQKNQRLAVDVLGELRAAGEDLLLVLIGPITNEAYRRDLASKITQAGLDENVLLIPGLPPGSQQLYDAYSAADVFLLSSVHEPFGIVILEAWAAGTPVVAASVGGVPAFTENGKDILRFESNDAETATKHVRRLFRETGTADALVTAAREKVQETYHWDGITKRLAEMYGELIESRKGQP